MNNTIPISSVIRRIGKDAILAPNTSTVKTVSIESSSDGRAHKVTFLRLEDNENELIDEVSIIRKGDGKDIICLPTQTSCNQGCTFCHLTGNKVVAKGLTSLQMSSLLRASIFAHKPESDTLLISLMGAGEPLDNMRSVVIGIILMTSTAWRCGYEKVRFAISTIFPKKFLKEEREDNYWSSIISHLPERARGLKVHWSLHTLDEELRHKIMPAAGGVEASLAELQKIRDAGHATEIHYTVMPGVNDRSEDLELFDQKLDRKTPVKLLRFAPRPDDRNVLAVDRTIEFKAALEGLGFTVEDYSPPGSDIGAACGQFVLDRHVRLSDSLPFNPSDSDRLESDGLLFQMPPAHPVDVVKTTGTGDESERITGN